MGHLAGAALGVALAAASTTVLWAGGRGSSPPVLAVALRYFEGQSDRSADDFLDRLRPRPLSPADRAAILAGLPRPGVVQPGTSELAKFAAAAPVLAYHEREGQITFRIVDVSTGSMGLYGRSVLLVSRTVLPLVTREEFMALVAHEMGHEYVWSEYETAKRRGDRPRLLELELRCDGIAVLTLQRLQVPVEHLVSAVEKLTWYNEVRRQSANADRYVPLRERVAFIRAAAALPWRDRAVGLSAASRSRPATPSCPAAGGC